MFETFSQLPIHISLQKAIHHLGYQSLTPIQSQILPHTLAGQDAIGQAQTGTGKTATFLLTIINELLNNPLQPKQMANAILAKHAHLFWRLPVNWHSKSIKIVWI